MLSRHRLCYRNPEAVPPTPDLKQTGDALRQLSEKVEGQETDMHIGRYLHIEGNGAEELGKQTIDRKHLPLLRAMQQSVTLHVSVADGKREMRVEKDGALLGTITTLDTPDTLWKGDVLRLLQGQTKGLLVDSLRGEDYDKAMALESAEFKGKTLRALSETNQISPKLQRQIEQICSPKEAALIGRTAVPAVGTAPASTETVVASKEKPGTVLAVFDTGKKYTAGPEENIFRVKGMNFHPALEEIPTASMVEYVRLLTGLTQTIERPSVTVSHANEQATITVLDLGDGKGKTQKVASVVIDTATGKLLSKELPK